MRFIKFETKNMNHWCIHAVLSKQFSLLNPIFISFTSKTRPYILMLAQKIKRKRSTSTIHMHPSVSNATHNKTTNNRFNLKAIKSGKWCLMRTQKKKQKKRTKSCFCYLGWKEKNCIVACLNCYVRTGMLMNRII